MGYTYSFVDDSSYSAKDINNITKRLVTQGVEDDFSDGVPYNTGRLNVISNKIATEGVVPENNTSLKVELADDGKIKINKGCAFMESGATFEVDDEGVFLEYSLVSNSYVYIEDNATLCTIRPVVSESLPVGYGYVLLASVTKKGEITDERKFAKGKLPGYMSDFNMPKRFEVKVEDEGEYVVDIGTNDASFIMVTEDYEDSTAAAYDSFGVWNKFDNVYLYTTGNIKGIRKSTEAFYLKPYASSNYVIKVTMSFEGTSAKLNVEKVGTGVMRTRLEITVI